MQILATHIDLGKRILEKSKFCEERKMPIETVWKVKACKFVGAFVEGGAGKKERQDGQ